LRDNEWEIWNGREEDQEKKGGQENEGARENGEMARSFSFSFLILTFRSIETLR
jgi:hypothetical protein